MKFAIWEDLLIIFLAFLFIIFGEMGQNSFGNMIEKLSKDPRKMRNEFSVV
jgi:hypothetical protein